MTTKTGLLVLIIAAVISLYAYNKLLAKKIPRIFVISRGIMEDISEAEGPKKGEELKYVELIALRGEYEPFSFSVYCKEGCKGLNADLSPFRHVAASNAKIGRGHVEINRLRMGEALYKVKDWLLDPAEDLTVKEDRSARFWITVHVPVDATPGIYKGSLRVSSQAGRKVEIPVELKVLQQKHEDIQDVQFAMLYTVSPFGQYYRPEKHDQLLPDVLAFYDELRSHGMTSISPKNSDWPYRKGNIDGLRAEIQAALRSGLRGPVLWYMSSLINGAKGGKLYTQYDGKCDNWNESRDMANLREIVATVKEAEEKENWPEVIFITVDEPGTSTEDRRILNLRMDILEKTLETVHELGARGGTTLTEPVDDKHNRPPFVAIPDELRHRWDHIRPYTSIRIYGYGYPQGITNVFAEKADAERRGHEVWFYNNEASLGRNRYMARLFFGLWGWKIGAHGLASWTYPGGRTVQWELIREGIDDFKYLRLIQRMSKSGSADSAGRMAAEAFLMEVSDSVKLDSNGFITDLEEWKNFDFNKFRKTAAGIIEELSNKLN